MIRRVLTTTWMLLAAFVLWGCGSEAFVRDDGVERIELWHAFNPEETAVFREIIAQFERDYEARTGQPVRVDLQYVSYGDMFMKLRTAAMARITPDVAFLDSIKVLDLAYGRAALPLDEMPAFRERYGTIDGAREEFVAASFDAGVINRAGEVNLYGLPVQSTTVALFWNREMFRNRAAALREAGLNPNRAPQDWDELIEYGRILTEPERGIHGYGMSGSLWFNLPLFNMYEAEFVGFDENGHGYPRINSPNAEAALRRIHMLAMSGVEGGAWRRGALFPDAGFTNQRYAMIVMGPWNVERFLNAGLDFDISYIPAPPQAEIEELGLSPKGPEELGVAAYSSSNVGGQTGVIMRMTRNPELSYEVLEYFTSEPVQRRWASELGQIPVRLAAWEDLDVSRYPYLPVFMQQLAMANRPPQAPLYGILEDDIFNPQIDLLLQDRTTPQTMLGRMEAAMEDRIFARMNQALDGLDTGK